MCSASTPSAAVDGACVGVFAWTRADGASRSCAVTPYVVDGRIVVTSTLALPSKAYAVQHNPGVALLAGGWLIQARVQVGVDTSADWFDRHLREQELAKYPPARSILGIPGHRRWFPWYLGRVVISFVDVIATERVDGEDRVSIASGVDGRVRVDPIPAPPTIPQGDDWIRPPAAVTGPVDVLVHEESDDFAELRQLHIRGTAAGGMLVDPIVTGSLAPSPKRAIQQLTELRALGRLAKHQRDRLTAVPPIVEELQ